MGFSITAGQRLACVTLGVKGSQAKPGVPWFGNFFDGWTNAGGNGAAMRIQPHVWAAKSLTSPDQYWSDIFLDSINTHGNPRAIAGALLHGAALGRAIESGAVPGPDEWNNLLEVCQDALRIAVEHPNISAVWLPNWEQQTGPAQTGSMGDLVFCPNWTVLSPTGAQSRSGRNRLTCLLQVQHPVGW
ncbi:hypothetical protein GCM10023214_61970 [Amycolatopsis dongchuanensis]|uniref:Uncharacterized protein n=2 Tax=Amycolatopsis dongchuanensis TaxID=1070866 RepID=A0ABP8VHG3_9PSEU